MQKKIFISLLSMIGMLSVYAHEVKGTLRGVVTDSVTGLSLPGATISIPDLKLTSLSDAKGEYVFHQIPEGQLTILVSFIGYKTIARLISIKGNIVENFRLQPSVVENENVTITGVASSTRISRMAMQVSVISKKEIEQSTGSNLLDVIAKEPGISIVTTGPAIAKPVIRGLGFNRVVTINDGMRQEGQQWGDEHGIEIDEYSARKIEVLKGPASLMYGSDAIGGVINIITNSAIANNTMQANLSTGFNSNNYLYGVNAAVAGNKNGLNWNLYGSMKTAGDYKNKYDGRVLNSRFEEKNFGGHLGLNKSWGFSHLIFSQFNQKPGIVEGERDDEGNFILDGYLPSKNAKVNRKPLAPYQTIQHTKLALDNSISLKQAGRINALIGFQQNRRKEFADPMHESLAETAMDLSTINYNLAYHLPEIHELKSSIGINGMSQTNNNKADEAIIPNYNLFDFGVYSMLSKTINKTTLSGGLRFDTRNFNGKERWEEGEQKFSAFHKIFSNFSGSLGITQGVKENLFLKANISRGYRAPNASELMANGEHEGTNRFEIGNRNLKSEVSTATDIGVDFKTNHLSLNCSPYFNHVRNFIFYNKLKSLDTGDSLRNGVPVFQFNQQSAVLYGVDLALDLHPHPMDWLHFENTFSWVNGQFVKPVDGSIHLPLMAPASVLTELRAEFPKLLNILTNFYGRVEVNTVASQNKFFEGFQTETATNSYVLVNTGIGADVELQHKKLFTFHFSINNISDVAYQSHLSRLKYAAVNPVTGKQGVFNMGRNITIKIIAPFKWIL